MTTVEMQMKGLMPQREFEKAVKQNHIAFDADTARALFEEENELLEIIGGFVEYIPLGIFQGRHIVLVFSVGGEDLERPLLFYKSTGQNANRKRNLDMALAVMFGEMTVEAANQQAQSTSLAGFWIPFNGIDAASLWMRKMDMEMAQQELTPYGQKRLLKYSRLVSDFHAAVSAWLSANPPDESLFPHPASLTNCENLKLLFEQELDKEKCSLLITEHLAAQPSTNAANVQLETQAYGVEPNPLELWGP